MFTIQIGAQPDASGIVLAGVVRVEYALIPTLNDDDSTQQARFIMVRKGDKAPGFTLPRKPGEMVDVGADIGKHKVVLLFMPFAYSGVCSAEMCHMRDHFSDFSKLDAKVYGITVDSPFVTDKWRQDENIPFPILSDFNKEVASQYGVLHEQLKIFRGVAKRSAFVIDTDGNVVYSWVTEDPSQQVKFDEIAAAVTS